MTIRVIIRATLPALLLGAVLAAFVCPPAKAATQGSGQGGYAIVRAGSLYVGGDSIGQAEKSGQGKSAGQGAGQAEKPGQGSGQASGQTLSTWQDKSAWQSKSSKQGTGQASSTGQGAGQGAGQVKSSVELHILDNNFFVLRQISALAGKEPVIRDLTGNWRQVEGGSLLQLTNRHGMAMGLNIGATGNLYGDFSPLPDGRTPSLILKQVPARSQSFFIMGRLDRSPSRSSLTDSGSGRVFSPLSGEALASLPDDTPLLVDVEVSPKGKGLHVESIRSFSSRFPQFSPAAPTVQDFTGDVEAHVWMLPSLKGIGAASCTFKGDGKGRGLLEITGKGLRLTAEYALSSGEVVFTVNEQDERNLRSAGAEALPEMFTNVRGWAIEGGALVLSEPEGKSFVLEKATLRGRR